jgi:hypothetical protein
MSRLKVAREPERPIFEASNPMLMLPFNGELLPFRVKKLTSNQILSLGNVSVIETFHDKINKARTPTPEEMNEYAERQHQLVKLAMVQPTYDEVIAQVVPGFDWKALEAELADIKTRFKAMKPGKDKSELQNRYNLAEMRYKFILPADFIGAVLDFCLDISSSGIRAVTSDILLHAAVLATRGHDNPSDHVDTTLMTPFHRQDFDNRAWLEFDRKQAEIKQQQKRA